jgi:hypothetical protein
LTGTAPNLVAGNVTPTILIILIQLIKCYGVRTGVYGTAGIYCNPSTKHFIQMVI